MSEENPVSLLQALYSGGGAEPAGKRKRAAVVKNNGYVNYYFKGNPPVPNWVVVVDSQTAEKPVPPSQRSVVEAAPGEVVEICGCPPGFQ